ncbi:50S ribosomal protein L29 [Candidatus Profftella armatura]|uniref:Large ribosomal subunit protein uL29 n=1 Tax=Candidatus Profftella armatura TaxID=669502 RepID=S5R3F5_9PROT|nr:50S ribosomal protein L29 [Candidatus Profftella armatura]AGS06734.1 50S ribosomal protein L29 [Candidatus Profftella armatura]ALC95853.1 50S ribosomal protein L29 [Candidatus Profftella armatura]QLK13648.1 50S ribosomal protein L29 [Candidatus Profftella armatura]
MKIYELLKKDKKDLNKELIELLKIQFSLRIQIKTQKLHNISQIKKIRRNIARIKTILNIRNV